MRKGPFLNGLVLALLASASAAWSFWAFLGQGQMEGDGWVLDEGMAFDQDLEVSVAGTVRFNGRDSVTLLANSAATLHWDAEEQAVLVTLKRGGLVFSTVADDFHVSVSAPFARVDSQHSTAVVLLDDASTQLEVDAITHPSLVTFTENGQDLNALSVPTSYRMKVPASKVTDLLGRLRLTKLSKEFPLYTLADGDLNEETLEVLSSVQAAYDARSVAFLSQVQAESDFGPSLTGFGGTLHSGYASFRDLLTVLPSAKANLVNLRKEEALIYAMTNFLYGDAILAESWLTEWQMVSHSKVELQNLYSSLFAVLPGDALYPVKSATATLLYPQEDALLGLRRQYAQIESLLDRASQVEAQQAYQDYQKQFEDALQAGDFDALASLSDISREYTLLELMLRNHSVFYSVESTQLLKDLETKILALAGSSQDVDEELQTFVQSKLRFLDKLFSFVTEKKLAIKPATELANELIFEANAYMGKVTTQVAVSDYFKAQLVADQLSVQFMNSPEFYTYSSFAEGLAAYKAKVADLDELNAYIQNIRSGQEQDATVSADAAQQEVEEALSGHAVQYSAVLSLGDTANRLFQIQGARTAGYAFEAKYDRETQIFYDVVVGSVRFSTGLKLEDAKNVIEAAMVGQTAPEEAVPSDTSVVPSTESSASLTESVALQLAASQFTAAGLKADDFVFTVVDLDKNTFTFEGTLTAAALPVSGTYDATSQKVSEIVWELKGTPQTLPDVALTDFESSLEATYQAVTSAS